jgi:choline-phosphate cytidylyltransferase
MIRVYADGVFDLFHYGHARLLEQIKMAFPGCYLIVGVCGDEDVTQYKRKPVLTHSERCESVRHCKWVDEVYGGAPWVITEEFLTGMDIDFVAHDGNEYAVANFGDAYATPKRLGRFWATQRTEGVSTSDIIGRIRDSHNLLKCV